MNIAQLDGMFCTHSTRKGLAMDGLTLLFIASKLQKKIALLGDLATDKKYSVHGD